MVQVSFSTSTTYEGEANALIEEQDTSLTVNFELDEPAPVGGLRVFVDSNFTIVPGFCHTKVAPVLVVQHLEKSSWRSVAALLRGAFSVYLTRCEPKNDSLF